VGRRPEVFVRLVSMAEGHLDGEGPGELKG